MKLTTKCFEGENWSNVSLEQFLECDQNLAFNRQTRMLADLSLIGCYSNIFNLTSNHLDRFSFADSNMTLNNFLLNLKIMIETTSPVKMITRQVEDI